MTAPSEQKLVHCPNCGKPVMWSDKQRWRPFCSERCKLIDLGEWFDESHRIAGETTTSEGTDTDQE